MTWKVITDIILILAIATPCIFASLALYQWIANKSIKKVDKCLLWIPLPIVLMTITWIIFDKIFILDVRPNNSGEPSFPSTHVMFVATIFSIVMIILPKYIKSKILYNTLRLIMIILIILTCVGRVASNMHRPLDVVGALTFALIFAKIYYYIIHRKGYQK